MRIFKIYDIMLKVFLESFCISCVEECLFCKFLLVLSIISFIFVFCLFRGIGEGVVFNFIILIFIVLMFENGNF